MLKVECTSGTTPLSFIICNIPMSIWAINVVRQGHEVVLHLKGKSGLFLMVGGVNAGANVKAIG